MRALHVTPYFAPAFHYGGPPRSVLGLCRALIDEGIDTTVLTTTADGAADLPVEVTSRGEYEGVPVRYLPRTFPRRYFNAAGLKTALDAALMTADVVHVHGLWSVPVWRAARASARAGIPFVVSPRGMLDDGSFAHHRMRKRIAYRLWERRYLETASLLHATSQAEETSLARLSIGPPVVRVPNGLSPPPPGAPARFRQTLGIDERAPLVAYVGRLHPTKRLDLLRAAFDELRASIPSARLILAGPEDGLRADALLRSFDEPSTVVWAGALGTNDKWSLLSEADALVMCSDSESFGMSVVEAMAMGTPVVVTKTCPWQDVESRGAGFWVAQNSGAITEALSTLFSDRERASRMGARGRELVDERYRWPVIARTMSECYDRVVR